MSLTVLTLINALVNFIRTECALRWFPFGVSEKQDKIGSLITNVVFLVLMVLDYAVVNSSGDYGELQGCMVAAGIFLVGIIVGPIICRAYRGYF